MQKDFDSWNIKKKSVDSRQDAPFFKEGEVWWCSLGVNIGFEQDGNGFDYDRPVLIIRAFSRAVCLVVPLTTSIKENPYHVSAGIVDGKNASAIISQIRLVDTKRFINRAAVLSDEIFETMRKAIRGII
jgi:mRNA interferase MazF